MEEKKKKTTSKRSTSSTTKKKTTTTKRKTTTKKTTTPKRTTTSKKKPIQSTNNAVKEIDSIISSIDVVENTEEPKQDELPEVEVKVEKPKVVKKKTTPKKRSTTKKTTVTKKPEQPVETNDSAANALKDINKIINIIDDIESNMDDKGIEDFNPVEVSVVEEVSVEPVVTKKRSTTRKKSTTRRKKEVIPTEQPTDNKIDAIKDINEIINTIDDIQANLDEKEIETKEEPKQEELPEVEFKLEEQVIVEETKSDEIPIETYEEPKVNSIELTEKILDEPIKEESFDEPIDKPKTKTKLKTSAKIFIFFVVISIIGLVVLINLNKHDRSDIINNSSYSNGLGIVEFKCVNNKLNNIIINSNMINEMKKNDPKYDKKLKTILDNKSINSYLASNIKKAIELDIVDENNTLKEYYYKALGFNNIKELIDLFDDTINKLKKNQE